MKVIEMENRHDKRTHVRDDIVHGMEREKTGYIEPTVHYETRAEGRYIYIECPGITPKSEVKTTLSRGLLEIKASMEKEMDIPGTLEHKNYREYKINVNIPSKTTKENIEIKIKKGIIIIKVPRE